MKYKPGQYGIVIKDSETFKAGDTIHIDGIDENYYLCHDINDKSITGYLEEDHIYSVDPKSVKSRKV